MKRVYFKLSSLQICWPTIHPLVTYFTVSAGQFERKTPIQREQNYATKTLSESTILIQVSVKP